MTLTEAIEHCEAMVDTARLEADGYRRSADALARLPFPAPLIDADLDREHAEALTRDADALGTVLAALALSYPPDASRVGDEENGALDR